MMNKSATNPWLVCPLPKPGARMRLFCFPYAGGKALTFRGWSEGLGPAVEVWVLQPPGMFGGPQRRRFTRLLPLVEEVAGALRPHLDKPFAFFGHSMGALVGFELARLLRRGRGPQPLHLFASGRRAPQVPDPDPPSYDLPEAEFIEELRRLNGTPPEVLEHPELVELMIPHLRADFEIVQTYAYTDEPPLGLPISAFGGLQDEEVPPPYLEAWREQTASHFSLRMLPGDHFFVDTARPHLLTHVSEDLSRYHL